MLDILTTLLCRGEMHVLRFWGGQADGGGEGGRKKEEKGSEFHGLLSPRFLAVPNNHRRLIAHRGLGTDGGEML